MIKVAKTADRAYLFENMPVKRAVLKQIIPAVFSQIIVLIYNLADTYFVGMLNDPIQTAAVTVSYPAFVMLTAISNFFAIGGASLLARSLGQKNEEKAKSVSVISFWGGLVCAVLFSLLFWLLAAPVLHLCGATAETYDAAFRYSKWVIIIGGAGTILNVLLSNLVRAEGNAVMAAIGVTLGGFTNIILDPFFALPQFLGFGAEGAGMATAISNLTATLFFLIYICARRKHTIITISPRHLKDTPKYIAGIISIGIPSAIQYALTVVSVAALSKFVSGYETAAVAGLGIVKKLDQLPLYFSIGVANGLLPFLAYNFSSGNQKRRHNAFVFGAAISFVFSILCLVCYEAFAPVLTGLFIKDAATIAYSSKFLRIMVVAMPMMSLCYPMIIQFQAMGKVRESLICSILRKGVLDIPLLFIMNTMIPLYGCMAVQPIVDGISLVAAWYFYQKINKSMAITNATEPVNGQNE